MNWHDYFTYDNETGFLTWKPRPREFFCSHKSWRCWSGIYSGKRAGCYSLRPDGEKSYARVGIGGSGNNKTILVHRIVWEMHGNSVPDGMMVDHADGDAWNNRIQNLRLATRAQNQQNMRLPITNTSGYKGVHRVGNRWKARLRANGKIVHLGYHDTAEEANKAYVDGAKIHHGAFHRQIT